LIFRDRSHWISSEKRETDFPLKSMWLQRDSSTKSTHEYFWLSSVEKKETGAVKMGETAWPRTARDIQPVVWPPRQRRIPTKNSLVMGSQKSWGWDKPDVCASLRTALGTLNYKDLRDFTENHRHPDTKITFIFLSESGLGFPTFPGIKTFANNGRERQTAQSETQLRENPGSSSLRSRRADTLLTWKDVSVMVTLLLKDHRCSLLWSRNEICSACLLPRQGKANC